MKRRPALSIVPHEGSGGCVPSTRNDSVASVRIAVENESVVVLDNATAWPWLSTHRRAALFLGDVRRSPDVALALAGAHDSDYGLASSVWTSDIGKGMATASRLHYGCTWVNTHFMLVNEMPHGGLKSSGYGKDLSMYALEDYTVPRHVMVKL